MEELTPELERRIQVEELWGRRIVLEETRNDWRFREYQSRRLLSLLHNEVGSPPKKPLMAKPLKAAKPVRASYIFSGRRTAIIAGLAVFISLAMQQSYAKFFMGGSAVRKIDISADGIKPRSEARTLKSETEIWNRPGQAHAAKFRPLDADLKKVFGFSP